LYAYAKNDPVNHVDVIGESPLLVAGAAAGVCTIGMLGYAGGKYPNDENSGSSKRHCLASCLIARYCGGLNPYLPVALGFGFEAWTVFSTDWKQDLIDNQRGAFYGVNVFASCEEQCDPDPCPVK
jgi:hypothetical protein